MDWLEIARTRILVYIVLLTICPVIESTFHNFDYIPGGHTIPDIEECPPNTIFCMERKRCVNLDGTCIEPPTCRQDEVHQTNAYGLPQCVLFENTCWPDEEEACDVDGALTCVGKGKCHSVEVKLRVEGSYSDIVGDEYEGTSQHFKTQIAAETGLNPRQLLDFSLLPGSIYIVFRAPLSAYHILWSAANRQVQFLTDRSDNMLSIDWEQSWMGEQGAYEKPGEEYFEVWQDCKQGQLFCFQSMKCVNVDGTCPAEPTCQLHQMLCNTGGELGCVDYGACDYMEGYLYLRGADFDAVVGAELENMNQFTDHFKDEITDMLQASKDKIWGVSFERGSIGIRFFATLDLYDKLMELKKHEEQFITDLVGNQLVVSWDQFYAHEYKFTEWQTGYYEDCRDGVCVTCPYNMRVDWSRKECVLDDYYDDDSHKYDEWHQCKQGQLFCFETMRCVNVDGSCPTEQSCELHQMLCNKDGRVGCVDHGSCNYMEGYVYLGSADFDTVLGSDFARKTDFTKHFKSLLSNELFAMSNDIWDVRYETGSIGIHFSTLTELYDKFTALQNTQAQFITDLDGNPLQINWGHSYASVHEAWDGDNDERNGWGNGGGPDYCPDCHHEGGSECGYNELFCFETLQCVNKDSGCTTDSEECPGQDEELCPDGEGNYVCKPRPYCYDDGNFVTIHGEFTLDADYAQYVEKDNGVSATHDLKMSISKIANIDPASIIEVVLKPGSIIAQMTFIGMPDELKAAVDAIQDHFINDGSINIGGIVVKILSFISEEILDSEGSGYDSCHGDDCKADNWYICGNDELFCFETLQCVTKDGGCSNSTSGQCPGQEACPDGKGSYICKPVGECDDMYSFGTAEVSISLDGDYDIIVGGKKEAVMQELDTNLPDQLGIMPNLLNILDITMGSIIISTEIGPASGIELKMYIETLKMLLNNKGTILISGNPLAIIDVDVLRYPDFLDDRDDHLPYTDKDYDEQNCPTGQIFCLEKNMCVLTNYDMASCQPDAEHCSDTEEFCLDAYGYGYCVATGACSIKSVKLTMVVDGNYEQIKESEAMVLERLKPQIAALLLIEENDIKEIKLFPGSISIEVYLLLTDPIQLDSLIQTFEEKVTLSEIQIEILGAQYQVKPDSFKVQVDSVDFVPDCESSGTCVECLDQETQCNNLDGSRSVSCVPKDMCRLASVCPVLEKDTLSACVFECDPKIDKKKSTGELCCPLACGGGAYMAVPESYICPRDETTGVCLTLEDIKCESGKDWCAVSFTCETTEECENLATKLAIDDVTTSDRFIIHLLLSTDWESSVTIFKTTESQTSFFEEALPQFQNLVEQTLEQTFTSIENKVSIENVAVYPEGIDLHQLAIYADVVSAIPGAITVDDIKEKVMVLAFSSQYFPKTSLASGDGPAVIAVLGSAKHQVYVMREPVVAETDSTFNLLSVVPSDLFTSPTVEATLNCSGQDVEIHIGGTSQQTAVISVADSISIRHRHPDIATSKCEITSNQFKDIPDGIGIFIGFIAVPKAVEKLAVAIIGLNDEMSLQTDEDSTECLTVPDDLITLTIEGDALFDVFHSWPTQMTGAGEIWHLQGLPISRRIKTLLKTYQIARARVMNNFRTAVSLDESNAAKLYYKDEPVREGDIIDVLTSKENLQQLKICVTEDYSGLFNLTFTHIQRDSTEGNTVSIPIRVSSLNDAPYLISRDFSQAMEQFAHPAASDETPDGITESVFTVDSLLSVLFTDGDADVLGMALVASMTSSVGVVGKWEYTRDGSTWTDIGDIVPPETDDTSLVVTLLNPTDKIRYTTQESSAWKRNDAPTLVFLAWDRSNSDDIGFDLTDSVPLTKCHNLEKGMRKFCKQDGSSAYSREVVVLPLARMGCDGVPDSRKENFRCGCGDDTSCLDCHNVANGNAKFDKCGVCGGSKTEIDCAVSACRQNNSMYCTMKDEGQDIVENLCEDGQELISPEYSAYCESRCIQANEDVKVACDLPCGIVECLDCANENGKNEINLCGICRPIDTLNEGCQSIGNIVPPMSNPMEIMNITVDVARSLIPADTSDIPVECTLEQRDPALTGIQVPEVLSTNFQTGSQTTAPSVVLTVHTSTEVDSLPALGEFAVRCEINGNSVSTADADQYLRLYDNPTLDFVTPADSVINDLSEVTVTGNGIIDTGKIYCMIPCSEIDKQCDFTVVKGVRLNDTGATCPVRRLMSRRVGQTYSIYVIVDDLSNVDTARLTQSNAATFSVVMPAPAVVSAHLNKDECHTVTVKFDTRVTGADDEDCTNYFDNSSPLSADAKCTLLPRSKKLYIKNVGTDLEDQELQFKANVIKNAEETNTDGVNFLTGIVTVQGEEEPFVQIDPRIPDKVGCIAVTLKPRIKNKGCWEIEMSWTVSAEGADAAHISALQNEINQKDSFQLSGNQLQDNVEYTFTLSWKAGKYSGADDITVMKDSESGSIVNVYGIKDEYDVSETVKAKAKIKPCHTNDNDIAISWTLTPAVAQLEYTERTFPRIKGGNLQPLSSYELSYTVTFGNGDKVTGSVQFRTLALPIRARIGYKDDKSTKARELREDDDLVLSCVNLDDITNENEYSCIWTCTTNLLGNYEEEMLPCLEVEDSQFVQPELAGASITLNGADRLRPSKKFNLRQEWTVIMSRGGQTSSSSRTFEFKTVPTELSAPEIRRKRKNKDTYYVSESVTTLRIETFCRKATSYRWEASDDDGIAVFPFDVFKGETERDVTYRDKNKDCSIDLDFSDPDGDKLIPGEVYAVKLSVFNQQGDVYLSISDQFFIQYIQKPQNGTVAVIPENDTIIAWATELTVSLTGWWDPIDNTDLSCHVYYHNLLNSETSRLTTLPVSLDESISFTLPEGKFRIKAKCCNSYDKCARAKADDILTVQPTAPTDIISIIERDLTMMNTLESDIILGVFRDIKNVIETMIEDEAEAAKTANLLKEALKYSILTAFARSSDKPSRLAAMEQAVSVVTPTDLDGETKSSLQSEASGFVKEATGQGETESKRKKRSTTEFSQPVGLTESEAITVLQIFDSTINEETIEKDAALFKETIGEVMIGLCQAFSGSTPWHAPAQLSYVRVQRTNLAGFASVEKDISCSSCPEVEYPATVNYGQKLENEFNNTWDCTAYTECSDVCVATAQLNVDAITVGVAVAPTRMSDIIILKLINPETYQAKILPDIKIEVKLALNGTVDMDQYEYKCLMWVADDWSDVPCNTSTPTFDATISRYKAVCTCNALGIISIFQERKLEEIITSTTVSSQAQSSTSPADAANTDAPTTPAPSKPIKGGIDHVLIEFTLSDDFTASVGASETDLKNKMKEDMSAQTGISKSSFRVFQISPGSIIVTFELHTADSGSTLGQMVYKLEDMITSGSLTLSTTDGTSLNFKPGSFSYEEVDDDTEKETSDNLPFIIGGALGGLVIICVTTIVVLLIMKNKKQRTHPTNRGSDNQQGLRYNTPPPTYATAPPPPYMYVDPPQVNKWVENELNNKKRKPVEDKRPSSSGSNRSGSSFDQRMNNKVHSSEPTPVGE